MCSSKVLLSTSFRAEETRKKFAFVIIVRMYYSHDSSGNGVRRVESMPRRKKLFSTAVAFFSLSGTRKRAPVPGNGETF